MLRLYRCRFSRKAAVRIDSRDNAGCCDRAGGNLRRSQSAREHGVDARLELYAADGRLFQLFWPFSSWRRRRSPRRSGSSATSVEDSRLGPQRRMIGRLPADDPVELS